MPKFLGVDTNDPDIVKTVRNMTDRGDTVENMVKIIGMPREVIEAHRRDHLNYKNQKGGVPNEEKAQTEKAKVSKSP